MTRKRVHRGKYLCKLHLEFKITYQLRLEVVVDKHLVDAVQLDHNQAEDLKVDNLVVLGYSRVGIDHGHQ